jgi:hypothetical protein
MKRLTSLIFAISLALAVGVWVGIAPRVFLGTVGVFATLIAIEIGRRHWRAHRARRAFTNTFGHQGKDVLLVTSNSPNWQSYIDSEWLPRLNERAVVLNWSEREQWDREPPAAIAAFRTYAGPRDFNPLAIHFDTVGRVRVIRFWRAFRDYKHGKPQALYKAEATLFANLGLEPPHHGA